MRGITLRIQLIEQIQKSKLFEARPELGVDSVFKMKKPELLDRLFGGEGDGAMVHYDDDIVATKDLVSNTKKLSKTVASKICTFTDCMFDSWMHATCGETFVDTEQEGGQEEGHEEGKMITRTFSYKWSGKTLFQQWAVDPPTSTG